MDNQITYQLSLAEHSLPRPTKEDLKRIQTEFADALKSEVDVLDRTRKTQGAAPASAPGTAVGPTDSKPGRKNKKQAPATPGPKPGRKNKKQQPSTEPSAAHPHAAVDGALTPELPTRPPPSEFANAPSPPEQPANKRRPRRNNKGASATGEPVVKRPRGRPPKDRAAASAPAAAGETSSASAPAPPDPDSLEAASNSSDSTPTSTPTPVPRQSSRRRVQRQMPNADAIAAQLDDSPGASDDSEQMESDSDQNFASPPMPSFGLRNARAAPRGKRTRLPTLRLEK